MRPARGAAVALLAGVALAGCGGGGHSGGTSTAGRDRPPATGPKAARPADERVVRGWIAALNRRDYGRAADYFARGAVVQQTEAIRLGTHAQAVAFNRSLPCKAQVAEVRDEGRTVLATFKLLNGPGGRCEPTNGGVASARVRCVIRNGHFLAWRQLPAGQGVPKGKSA